MPLVVTVAFGSVLEAGDCKAARSAKRGALVDSHFWTGGRSASKSAARDLLYASGIDKVARRGDRLETGVGVKLDGTWSAASAGGLAGAGHDALVRGE